MCTAAALQAAERAIISAQAAAQQPCRLRATVADASSFCCTSGAQTAGHQQSVLTAGAYCATGPTFPVQASSVQPSVLRAAVAASNKPGCTLNVELTHTKCTAHCVHRSNPAGWQCKRASIHCAECCTATLRVADLAKRPTFDQLHALEVTPAAVQHLLDSHTPFQVRLNLLLQLQPGRNVCDVTCLRLAVLMYP